MKKFIIVIFLCISYKTYAYQDFLYDLSEFEHLKKNIAEFVDAQFNQNQPTIDELQLLSNFFLFAFAYAKKDIQYYALQDNLIKLVLKLKKAPPEKHTKYLNKLIVLTNKLSRITKKLQRKKTCWNHITTYLDQNEQQYVNRLMTAFASERLSILNQIVEANYNNFEGMIDTILNSSKKSAVAINTLSNCFQALLDKQLPFEHNNEYIALKEFDISTMLLGKIENEATTLAENCLAYSRYYTGFLTLSSVLDMIYYQIMREYLQKHATSPEHTTIIVNDQGIISFDQRTKPLPHVVN